ncbi:hypothetical protein ESCO_002703 [Escovopsis weberi]|uniref:Mediator of RNA polymerase II transcription subunit 9 n=1 Tax=Escovopsis weberi TaxID=150374 RepID=A0A0M8MWI0_ESCWE|nr:hypothetical protein ESCO_002703 [Escovopsis weberi]
MSSTTPPPLALPPTLSPDDLDALSELSIVLGKVRAGLQSSQGLATGTTPSGEPVGNSTSSGGGGGGSSGSGGVGVGGGGIVDGSAQEHLSFKDVPGATDRLKHKLQHARAQVRVLPDMDRTVNEQRAEIRELEARIAQQRALLERLRDGGLRFGKDASAADKMDL